MTPMTRKSYDEYEVGDEVDSYGRPITETDVILFTGIAGIKLAIFHDEEYCKRHSPFGTRIVPGPLILAFAAGMSMDILGEHTIAGLGFDRLRFHAPAKLNDTIRTRLRIDSKRDTSDGKRGILVVTQCVLNQAEQTVMECINTLMMRRTVR